MRDDTHIVVGASTQQNSGRPGDGSIEMSHLWDCGEWTSGNEHLSIDYKYESKSNINDLCNYNLIDNAKIIDIINIDNFFINKHKPKLTIISPKSIDNTLLLSKIYVKRYQLFCI